MIIGAKRVAQLDDNIAATAIELTGDELATLDKRVLLVGSGGLSHSPPVPTLATAPPSG